MKVEGPKGPNATSKSKKSSESGSSDVDFSQFLTGGTTASSGASASQSIAHLDTLLAVQGAEDPTARAAKKRVRVRAETILSELDKIRMAMLNGSLTIGHMIDVADVVASHRERIQDPALTALLDEIDLRAQVELAKLRYAVENTA